MEIHELNAGRPGVWNPEWRGSMNPTTTPITTARTTQEAVDIIHNLPERFALDTETVYTETVNPFTAELRVISLAWFDNNTTKSAVLDVKDMDNTALAAAFHDRAETIGVKKLTAVAFNANFDDPVTVRNLTGWDNTRPEAYTSLFNWVDLMFAEAIIRAGRPGKPYRSLSESVYKFLGWEMGGKGTVQTSYDAHTPLTDEQITYAAEDAICTLWLGDALQHELETAGLGLTFALECGARPALLSMEAHGLYFDKEGWDVKMGEIKDNLKGDLTNIAYATGGQATLFGPPVPQFNPGSTEDIRQNLNKFCPEIVKTFMEHENIQGEELPKGVSMDKKNLIKMRFIGKETGHDTTLIDALLSYSKNSKIISTYGEKMLQDLDDTSRFHSRYVQCETATGRTASKYPNAQNFSPLMKPFFKPPQRKLTAEGTEEEYVYIHMDLSQAELRTSAQLTGEKNRREAFQHGEDQHTKVAGLMFNVDMDRLKEESPHQFASYRSQAKPLNFGICYGISAAGLATQLTTSGTPTTTKEAGELMDKYYAALPQEAAWLNGRDNTIEQIKTSLSVGQTPGPAGQKPSNISLKQTLRLKTAKLLAGRKENWPDRYIKNLDAALLDEFKEDYFLYLTTTPEQVQHMGKEELTQARLEGVKEWGRGYDAPVVLRENGKPFEFSSKTIGGRRRYFQISYDEMMTEAFLMVVYGRAVGVRDSNRWKAAQALTSGADLTAARYGVKLANNPSIDGVTQPEGRRPLPWKKLVDIAKKNKPMRDEIVLNALKQMRHGKGPGGISMGDFFIMNASAKALNKYKNQYRNAPIQGTVADAVLLAMKTMKEELEENYPSVRLVTTVHDSIVAEAPISQAKEVGEKLQQIFQQSLGYFTPDVKIVADLDIARSMDVEGDPVKL